jgi:hypothetical protein
MSQHSVTWAECILRNWNSCLRGAFQLSAAIYEITRVLIHPALVGEGLGPFGGRDVAGFVEARCLAPVEEFPEGGAYRCGGAVSQKFSRH